MLVVVPCHSKSTWTTIVKWSAFHFPLHLFARVFPSACYGPAAVLLSRGSCADRSSILEVGASVRQRISAKLCYWRRLVMAMARDDSMLIQPPPSRLPSVMPNISQAHGRTSDRHVTFSRLGQPPRASIPNSGMRMSQCCRVYAHAVCLVR